MEGITVSGIESLIDQLNRAINEVQDVGVGRELRSMKSKLAEMRVALVELENVEEKHSRGDITPDHYFSQRKKLVRDFFAARDQISDSVVPNIAAYAPTPDGKGRLMKFKDFLKDKKEFIATGMDFVLTVAKVFVPH